MMMFLAKLVRILPLDIFPRAHKITAPYRKIFHPPLVQTFVPRILNLHPGLEILDRSGVHVGVPLVPVRHLLIFFALAARLVLFHAGLMQLHTLGMVLYQFGALTGADSIRLVLGLGSWGDRVRIPDMLARLAFIRRRIAGVVQSVFVAAAPRARYAIRLPSTYWPASQCLRPSIVLLHHVVGGLAGVRITLDERHFTGAAQLVLYPRA